MGGRGERNEMSFSCSISLKNESKYSYKSNYTFNNKLLCKKVIFTLLGN